MKVFIYGVFDPRKPDEFRVVGKTKRNLRVRLSDYVTQARLKQKRNWRMMPSYVWILKLLDKGVRPNIRLIETCNSKVWRQRERLAIATYRNRGHGLLNVHDGGNGSDDGKRKLDCGVCGMVKRERPGGQRYCLVCSQQYEAARRLGITVIEYREQLAA